MDEREIRSYNRRAWDRNVQAGEPWTVPASTETIARARRGDWEIFLTPGRPAPVAWFPRLEGMPVLCLASGGGQQGPILAAAGAQVTVLDNSPLQLEQDRQVAAREGLALELVLGDMTDLGRFPDAGFQLIVLPVSNLFIPDLEPLWAGTYRVLAPGGCLLAGMMNPLFYIFDRTALDEAGELVVRHSLPYSDLTSLDARERRAVTTAGWPLEFGHTLEAQLEGQIEAGFMLAGLYEDHDPRSVLSRYSAVYLASRALKPT